METGIPNKIATDKTDDLDAVLDKNKIEKIAIILTGKKVRVFSIPKTITKRTENIITISSAVGSYFIPLSIKNPIAPIIKKVKSVIKMEYIARR